MRLIGYISFLFLFFTLAFAQRQENFQIDYHKLPQMPKTGKNDTILVPWILYDEKEWMPYAELPVIDLHCKASAASLAASKAFLRLQNAVLVTYPFAQYAGKLMLAINDTLQTKKTPREKKDYLKQKEKELRDRFETPLSELSVYQGNILCKLIYRETGSSCYELIKQYRNGLSAFFYHAIGKFWGDDIKLSYDPNNNQEDWEIEQIVMAIKMNQRY